jgi:hypothetical protein
MERLVDLFHKRRVHKEEQKALVEVTREGLVPEGYKAVLSHDEHIALQPVADGASKGATWAEKNPAKPRPEKTENFTASVDNSRAAAGQPAIS